MEDWKLPEWTAKGECLEKFQLCDKITENFRKNGYDKNIKKKINPGRADI